MIQFEKPLRYALIFLCAILIIAQIFFVSRQGWSPIDEYAHMDYIEKLGRGKMPSISDTIEPEIFRDMLLHAKRNPAKPVMYRKELGIANYSYQSKHPPLYYMILTGPNKIMKWMHFTIFKRLQILRVFSFVLFLAGLILLIFIRKSLCKMAYKIPEYYPLLCIAWSLLIMTHERYGLGNNMISPLVINTAFLLMLRYLRRPCPRTLFGLIFLSALAVCCALTNVFILPVFFVACIKTFVKNLSAKDFTAVILACAGPGLLFIFWKLNSVPEPVAALYVNDFIRLYFRAGEHDYISFLQMFFNDAFTIDFIAKGFSLSVIFAILYIMNIPMTMLFYKRLSSSGYRWLKFTLVSFLYFILLTFFLNQYVDDVTWVALRHYLGFLPVLFIGMTSSLLLATKNRN